MSNQVNDRFEGLIAALNEGIYEKGSEIALSLLAMIAGESIILLGPPGVAKSMVARQMGNALSGGKGFEYLMSRFSTPDEIFGPVSISKLKDEDKYERATEGYLPSADVAFLDEIWKAGPAIQNTLLTIINEKIFRNGDTNVQVPLKLLIAASNELPAKDEGLEALWDRFIIRIVSRNIQDEQTFYRMLLDDGQAVAVPKKLQITAREYSAWQKEIEKVTVPAEVLQSISRIRHGLKAVTVMEKITRDVYVSDRRWKHIVRLLKTAAFINHNKEVGFGEMSIMRHCLWNEPDEQADITRIVAEANYHDIRERLTHLDGCLKRDIKDWEILKALRDHGGVNDPDWRLRVHNDYYYLVADHGTGRTFILVTDFKKIFPYNSYQSRTGNRAVTDGVMYQDPYNPKNTIIQVFEAFGDESKLHQVKNRQSVKLLRSDSSIYINGVEYHMDLLRPGEQQHFEADLDHTPRYNYTDEYNILSDEVYNRSRAVGESYFTDSEAADANNRIKDSLFENINKSKKLIERLIQ